MKVLVTGATGQIGGAVAEALRARGDEVVLLTRREKPGWTCVIGDISSEVELPPVDAVVHAAGVVSYWPARRAEQWAVNVDGTRRVLEASVRAGARRFVLTSSIAAIGWVEAGLADEDTPWNWQGLGLDYFETKKAAEDLVLAETRLEAVAVNPGITFGPGEVHPAAGRMILQVAAGGPPGVPCGATTAATLQDVVAGHLAALDRGRPGRRYILGGHPLEFVELFARIAGVLGKPAPTRVLSPTVMRLFGQIKRVQGLISGKEPDFTPALAEISARRRTCSSARAEAELGWRASPLEPAIAACWEDWRRRL